VNHERRESSSRRANHERQATPKHATAHHGRRARPARVAASSHLAAAMLLLAVNVSRETLTLARQIDQRSTRVRWS
jgi:hypothetical protein